MFVDNAVDAASGTVLLKALFAANDRETLWPGLFIDVVLTLSIAHDAVVAPARAILLGRQGTYVFVVKADQTVETRPVVVARQVGSEAVNEGGFSLSETTVVDGQIRLSPGVKVSLKETAHPANALRLSGRRSPRFGHTSRPPRGLLAAVHS